VHIHQLKNDIKFNLSMLLNEMETMDNQTVTYKQAKDHLKRLYDWSLNAHSCWSDFVSISYNDNGMSSVNFEHYGYIELVLFGNALTIFNNWGLEEVNKMIEEVLAENNQLAETE
jgi:hypothetical protein